MKIKEFLGGIFFSAMLLCSEGVMGQTLTQVTADNCSSLGLRGSAVGCWVLDCSAIEADRLATNSITNSADLLTHTETSTTNRVWKKLLIRGADTGAEYWGISTSYVDNLDEYGYDDWRLPTQRELMLIWIMYRSYPALGFTESNYWSGSTNDGNLNEAWYVSFVSSNAISGLTTVANKNSWQLAVRIVRELD